MWSMCWIVFFSFSLFSWFNSYVTILLVM
jgi:hypothetical protein